MQLYRVNTRHGGRTVGQVIAAEPDDVDGLVEARFLSPVVDVAQVPGHSIVPTAPPPAPTPEPQAEPIPVEPTDEASEIETAFDAAAPTTTPQVKAWVMDDAGPGSAAERADTALAAENERATPRQTLVDWLERIAAGWAE